MTYVLQVKASQVEGFLERSFPFLLLSLLLLTSLMHKKKKHKKKKKRKKKAVSSSVEILIGGL